MDDGVKCKYCQVYMEPTDWRTEACRVYRCPKCHYCRLIALPWQEVQGADEPDPVVARIPNTVDGGSLFTGTDLVQLHQNEVISTDEIRAIIGLPPRS